MPRRWSPAWPLAPNEENTDDAETGAGGSWVRTSGILLIAGFIVFAVGAGLPPPEAFTGSDERQREIVGAHPSRWVASALAIAGGVMLTLAGLAVLAATLIDDGARTWPLLGVVSYGVGAILWLIELAFRGTVFVTVATAAGDPPDWFEPVRAWAGAAYWGYMVLAYLGVAAVGVALLESRQVATGLAWVPIAFGVIGTVVYVGKFPRRAWTFFDIPGILYLVTAAVGAGILLRA